MPPPSFSSQANVAAPSISRATQALVKDVTSQAQKALLSDPQRLDAALGAVRALIADPALELPDSDADLLRQEARDVRRSAVCLAVAEKVNTRLLKIADEMDLQSPQQLSALLRLIEALAPLLDPTVVVFSWWELLLYPALKQPALPREDAARARYLVVYLMMAASPSAYPEPPAGPTDAEPAPGAGADGPAPPPVERAAPSVPVDLFYRFSTRVLELYVHESGARPPEPDDASNADDVGGADGSSPDETCRQNLELTLTLYGSRCPTYFFHHIAEALAEPYAQEPLLPLLVDFLRHHTIHTYRITSTSLPSQLITVLLTTESGLAASLGSTCLVMLLPHMPLWFIRGGAGGLPALFRVYSRMVCWRDAPDASDMQSPNARLLFTFMYGLFPCNMVHFLRSPIRYLRENQYQCPEQPNWEDLVDGSAIETRSRAVMRSHLLHPGLMEFDARTEVLDTKRWLQHDASDLTASCIGLSLESRGDAGSEALAGDQSSDQTMLEAAVLERVAPQEARSPGGPPSAAGSPDGASTGASPSASARGEMRQRVQALQRSNAVLRNQLSFELYLKEQHLQHIGKLHRDRIADAAIEAEQQNQYNTVRTLRAQLQAAQALQERQRAELQATSNRHIQWERELNAKLNMYREERRAWTTESVQLQTRLRESQDTVQVQAQQLAETSARLSELEREMSVAQPKLSRLEEYGGKVRQMSQCLSDWEKDLSKYERQREEMQRLLSWWSEMELMVRNSEADANAARRAAERDSLQVDRLQQQLAAFAETRERAGRREAAEAAPAPPAAPPAGNSGADAGLAARNRALELELLDARARIEELEADKRLRELHHGPPGGEAEERAALAPLNAAMSTPALMHTPASQAGTDAAVPPLSLDGDAPAEQAAL